MKVWIAWWSVDKDWDIIGVYSTKDRAEQAVANEKVHDSMSMEDTVYGVFTQEVK